MKGKNEWLLTEKWNDGKVGGHGPLPVRILYISKDWLSPSCSSTMNLHKPV